MTAKTRKLSISFPEVATIRMGDPKIKKINQQGREVQTVGPDLQDKFRVVFAPGAEEIRDAFTGVYGTDHPTKIRAMVPFPSVWMAWEHFNEAYNAGRMIARAQDDHFIVYRDPLTGEYQVRDSEPRMEYVPGMKIVYDRDGRHYELPMKSTGRLKLWLPELGRMVFFTLKTTSYYSCMNIDANLAAVQGIADALNGGNAAGIPLYIYRKEVEVTWNKPGGAAQRVKKWLVFIEVDPTFAGAMIKRMSDFALTGGAAVGRLNPGEITGSEDPDQPEEDEDEVVDQEPQYVDEKPAAVSTETPAPDSQPAPLTAEQVIAAAAHDAGGKLVRPMAPAVVKATIERRALSHAGKTPSANQIKLIATLIESAFVGQGKPDKIRHTVQAYLIGAESLKAAPGPFILALLDWLKPEQQESGEYVVDRQAAKELSSVWTAALESAGQQSLL